MTQEESDDDADLGAPILTLDLLGEDFCNRFEEQFRHHFTITTEELDDVDERQKNTNRFIDNILEYKNEYDLTPVYTLMSWVISHQNWKERNDWEEKINTFEIDVPGDEKVSICRSVYAYILDQQSKTRGLMEQHSILQL